VRTGLSTTTYNASEADYTLAFKTNQNEITSDLQMEILQYLQHAFERRELHTKLWFEKLKRRPL
jgi:hypothetical protein